MLVAIEGCDRAGKTTLFEQLRPLLPFATFVPSTPCDPRLKPVMREVEIREVRLWESLYDASRVYIADRCPFVDNVVYATVYDRGPVSYPEWRNELRVLYLRPTVEELQSRGGDPWDPDYSREREIYDDVIRPLQHHVTVGVVDAVAAIHSWIAEWRNEATGSRSRARYLSHLARRGRASADQREELWQLQLAAQRRRVEELRGYWRGSFGQPLGLPAVGPCDIRSEEATQRNKALLRQLPPKPSGAVLCHRCDERRCAEPRHIFWGTTRDNARDALLKGRRGNYAAILAREEQRLLELISGRLAELSLV